MLCTSRPTSSATSLLTVSSRDSPGTQSGPDSGVSTWLQGMKRALTQFAESSQSAVHPWGEGGLAPQEAAFSIRHQDDHGRRHLEEVRQEAAHAQRAPQAPPTPGVRVYLGVVGGAAPAPTPAAALTACLVSAGWLTGGRTEPGGEMPAQQRLSLPGPTQVSMSS